MFDAVILAVVLAVSVAPSSSVTVRLTVNVPALEYACVGATPVPVLPSPKFQAYDATVPSESDDPLPLNETDDPTVPEYGPFTLAVGAVFGALIFAVV